MDTLSAHAQSVAVKAARATFEQWIKQSNLSAKEVEKLRKVFGKLFDEAECRSFDKMAQQLQTIVGDVNSLSNELSKVDDGFGKVLGTIGMVIGGVSEITARIKEMQAAQRSGSGGMMQGMSAFLAIYGAMVQAGTGIYNAIAAAAERKWNDQVMIRTRELEAQNDMLEYQIALVDTLNGTDKLDKLKDNLSAAQALVDQTRESLSGTSLISGDSRIDAFIKDLNTGKRSVKDLEGYLTSLEFQLKTADPMNASRLATLRAEITLVKQALEYYSTSLKLTGDETIEQLIELSAQADEETKKKINSLIEYEKKLLEISKTISESLLGFSSKQLIDETEKLMEAVKGQGKDAAGTIEDFFKKALINSLRVRFLEKELTALTDDMEATADRNMTAAEKAGIKDASLFSEEDVKAFQDRYTKIVEDGQKKLEAWEKATGIDFGSESSSLQSESIGRQITEQTGSEIVGTFRAGYDIWKRQLIAIEGQSVNISALVQLTTEKLAVLNNIDRNTAGTVEKLTTAVKHLQNIDRSLGGHYAR